MQVLVRPLCAKATQDPCQQAQSHKHTVERTVCALLVVRLNFQADAISGILSRLPLHVCATNFHQAGVLSGVRELEVGLAHREWVIDYMPRAGHAPAKAESGCEQEPGLGCKVHCDSKAGGRYTQAYCSICTDLLSVLSDI